MKLDSMIHIQLINWTFWIILIYPVWIKLVFFPLELSNVSLDLIMQMFHSVVTLQKKLIDLKINDLSKLVCVQK